MISRNVLLGAATLLTATVGGAQTRRDSVAPLLPAVSVTATRTDLVATAQPISTTTFDRAALRSAGVTQVADLVRLMPGTSVLAGGSFGAQTALFMRGGESDYAQILVDGVPINAPGGFFDFGQLTLDTVDRVEIVRARATHNVAEPRIRDLADGPADTVGFFGFRSDAEVTRRLMELRAEAIVAPGHLLTVAAERATDREVNSSVSFSSFGDFPGALDAERTNDAVVAQLVGNVGLRSTYIVGVRRDENSAFGSFTTARAAGAVRVTPRTSLRGSIGTAFKAPTFFENFATGFTLGNPALAPERTQSVELGLVQDLADGRGSIGVTAFTQRFRDVIQYTATVPSGAPNFANLATARADGVELEGRWRVVGAVQVHGSYTYLDTEVTDAGANEGPSATFVNGDRLLRRPANLAVLGTRWARGRASVDLSATYTGERDDRDFTAFPATPVSQPAFTRVDLALAWPLLSAAGSIPLTGVARAENLLNAYYEPTLGFRAPGRSIFVGVRIGD